MVAQHTGCRSSAVGVFGERIVRGGATSQRGNWRDFSVQITRARCGNSAYWSHSIPMQQELDKPSGNSLPVLLSLDRQVGFPCCLECKNSAI